MTGADESFSILLVSGFGCCFCSKSVTGSLSFFSSGFDNSVQVHYCFLVLVLDYLVFVRKVWCAHNCPIVPVLKNVNFQAVLALEKCSPDHPRIGPDQLRLHF